jgi:glycosyltransferase involved in cell wall biosynthesis
MPFISVIIPAYNAALFIEDAVKSVLNQSFRDLEIICIDNNSTDNTWNILEQLKSVHGIVIAQEKKQGGSAARNKGLSVAQGMWIQFLDADDILYPDKLERQLKLLGNDVKLIVGAYDMSVNGGASEKFPILHKTYWELLIESGLGCTCSNLWSKEMLEEVGGWNEHYQSSQEYELLFRILQKIRPDQIALDEKSSVLYRRRISGSVSNSYFKNAVTRIELRQQFKEYISSHDVANASGLLSNASSFMFNDLRFIYTLNSDKAKVLYKSYFGNTYKPVHSYVTPWYYIWSYVILGFVATEKLFSMKRLFSHKKEHYF